MSAHVNGDSGAAMRPALVDPVAPPSPRAAADALPRPDEVVGARGAANGRVVATPPSAAAAGPVAPGSPPSRAHAGVVTRLLAAAVDAVAVVVLAALLDLAAAGARFLWSPMEFRWPRPTAIGTAGVLLVVAVVYLAAGWALTGRTYGARLMGLRVLSSRHRMLGWTRSLLRALVCVLWPVGLLWVGFSRTRLSLADVVLRTVVVYDARPYAHRED